MQKNSATRSAIMRAVRSKDTRPEMVVRRLVHGLGYRYRLHGKGLPGKPDLVFASRRKVILVNGCFWHGHNCTRGARQPTENADYWTAKIKSNVERDLASAAALQSAGWQMLTVWECETKVRDRDALLKRLVDFLEDI